MLRCFFFVKMECTLRQMNKGKDAQDMRCNGNFMTGTGRYYKQLLTERI